MIKKICSLMILTAVLVSPIYAQQGPPAGATGAGGGGRGGGGGGRGGNAAMATVMIKPGLSMVTGGGANALVRVTDDGIVVVNTKNRGQANYDAFMAQIKMISDKPIKYAVVGDVQVHRGGVRLHPYLDPGRVRGVPTGVGDAGVVVGAPALGVPHATNRAARTVM